jgi:plastocyanin
VGVHTHDDACRGDAVSYRLHPGFTLPQLPLSHADAVLWWCALTQGGVDADAISHEDYLNGPGDEVSNTFDTAGSYSFYCEPHQGAGMVGKIIVQ